MHFNQTNIPCDIRVLILFYSVEKKAYLGFIPNNQVAFVDQLRKVISQKQVTGRQGQHSIQPHSLPEIVTGPSLGPSIPMNMPQQGMGSLPAAQMHQVQNQVYFHCRLVAEKRAH